MAYIYETVGNEQLPQTTHHTLCTGVSGTGKGNLMEGVITQKVGKYKVIDLLDETRGENMKYAFKQSNPMMLNMMQRYKGKNKGKIVPTAYPNQIYMPLGERITECPNIPKNVKVVTFSLDELRVDEILYWFRDFEGAKDMLEYLYYLHPNMKIKEVIEFLKKVAKDKQSEEAEELLMPDVRSVRRVLVRLDKLVKSGMFYDGEDFETIRIKDVIQDPETICSFSSYLLKTDEERGLMYGLILKKIIDAKIRSRLPYPIIIYIREISYILGGKHTRVSHYEYLKFQVMRVIREGRDFGISLYADTQRRDDLEPLYRNQFNKIIQLRCLKKDAENLLGVANLPTQIIDKISKLTIGKAIVICSGQYWYPVTIPPALHSKKSAQEDVLKILNNKYGSTNYSSTIYFKYIERQEELTNT